MKNKDLERRMRALTEEVISEIDRLELSGATEYPVETEIPQTVTLGVTGITQTTADVESALKSMGTGGDITDLGVVWGTDPEPEYVKGAKFINQGLLPHFVNQLTGLLPDTEYFVRTFIQNKSGNYYSNQMEFHTLAKPDTPPDDEPPGEAGEDPAVVMGMQKLKVNGHYLATEDGKPFFYLADTGWLMLYRLTLEEISNYLDCRKAQGFNAIQVMLLSSRNERTDLGIPPNRNGDYPFHDRNRWNGWNGDPLSPNLDFWQFVLQAVSLAQVKGMYLCLLPVWGHAVYPEAPAWANESNLLFPTHPEGIQRAYEYGKWLGVYVKGFANVLWMLGGDRRAKGVDYDNTPVWDAMAKGLLQGRSDYLITFHPQGGPARSSTWFNDRSWLSMNTFQSGHGKNRPQYILEDWQLTPVRPTFDSEACYENITNEGVWLTAHDVRKAAYRAVFEGACGHVYGELNVFQFFDGSHPWFNANQLWTKSMHAEGAGQMGYLRSLMEAHPDHVNDKRVIYEGWADDGWHSIGEGDFRKVACAGEGWKLVYIPEIQAENPGSNYHPMGKSVVVNLWDFGNFRAGWFNPRTGETTPMGNCTNDGYHLFIPPYAGPQIDWVLMIQQTN